MKQLRLKDGDLVLGPGGLDIVEGSARLAQDLGCAAREEMGTDRFHPGWGSVLHTFIGRPADIDTAADIRSEMARVIQNYTLIQTDQVAKDSDAGLKSRFKQGDLISSVQAIETQQRTDTINVRAIVSTASGENLFIVRSIEAG